MHGGGFNNYYQYGGNSPYIYIDPDGNFVQAIIGAVVGAVVGAVSAILQGGDWKDVLISAAVGAVTGAVTGGVAAGVTGALAGSVSSTTASFIGGLAASAVGAGISMAQAAASGASMNQILLSGAVSFGSGALGAGFGASFSGLQQAGQAIMGYFSSVGISYAAAAATGSLNEDNWDDILISSSIGYWGSQIGSMVGSEIAAAGASSERGSAEVKYRGEGNIGTEEGQSDYYAIRGNSGSYGQDSAIDAVKNDLAGALLKQSNSAPPNPPHYRLQDSTIEGEAPHVPTALPEATERAIETLEPDVEAIAREHLETARAEGIDVRVRRARVTRAEQERVFQSMRSRFGPNARVARPGTSIHETGRAYDVYIMDGNGDRIVDGSHPAYQRVGEIGESLGLTWGGRWRPRPDMPHFQHR